MSNLLDTASSVVQIVWGPCAAVAFWYGWKKDRDKDKKERAKIDEERAVNNALLRAEVKAITDRMNKEFGGNSGGVRERINAMDKKIDEQTEKICHIDERSIQQGEDLAKLTGRFDEYKDGQND